MLSHGIKTYYKQWPERVFQHDQSRCNKLIYQRKCHLQMYCSIIMISTVFSAGAAYH